MGCLATPKHPLPPAPIAAAKRAAQRVHWLSFAHLWSERVPKRYKDLVLDLENMLNDTIHTFWANKNLSLIVQMSLKTVRRLNNSGLHLSQSLLVSMIINNHVPYGILEPFIDYLPSTI